MVSDSNEQQSLCEDPFSSATPYAGGLEHNIDIDLLIIHRQNIRQCHFPGDQNQNWAGGRYDEEA